MPVWNGTDNYFTDFKLEKFMFYLCDADDECEHLKIIREW